MNSISAINNSFSMGNAELRAAALAENLREKALQAATSVAANSEASPNLGITNSVASPANFAGISGLPFDPASISGSISPSSLENAHKGLDPSRVASLLGLE